ncbi:MAG: DUF1801 domain-containing protein [Bacteroidota bacterium]
MTDSEKVNVHISKLDAEIAPTISYLRKVILETDIEIAEQIKWNNPCFYFAGEIKAYNPKEYKREIIVFNTHKNRILLVFPSGAKVNDTTGFLEGTYADGRRLVTFKDLEDVKAKEEILKDIIKKWLSLVEK